MTSQACRETFKMTISSNKHTPYQQEQKHFTEDNRKPFFTPTSNRTSLTSPLVHIQAGLESLMDFIEIYEWRWTTDYPIIRCIWKRVIFNRCTAFITNKTSKVQLAAQINSRHPSQTASLWVQAEHIIPLEHFQFLSITQFMYAFKEALVGFERLYALFGAFEINPRMIGVNDDGKVKVWVSQQFHNNAKTDVDQDRLLGGEEQHLVTQIKDVFLRLASDSSTFRQFFKGITDLKSFIDCLKYIEDFSSSKRIMISRKILKKPSSPQKRPLSPIINLKPIARTPKFIKLMPKPMFKEPIPSLLFRKSVQNQHGFHFSELKTKETMNQPDCEDTCQDSPKNAGKIVKNKGRNHLLSQAKSLKNLYQMENDSSADGKIEGSTIEQQMRRLLEDDPFQQVQDGKKSLMHLGRQVRQSFTIL